jgi:hypothetical protein
MFRGEGRRRRGADTYDESGDDFDVKRVIVRRYEYRMGRGGGEYFMS